MKLELALSVCMKFVAVSWKAGPNTTELDMSLFQVKETNLLEVLKFDSILTKNMNINVNDEDSIIERKW